MAERDDDRFRAKLRRPRARDGAATQASLALREGHEPGWRGASRRLVSGSRGLSQFHRGAADVPGTLKPRAAPETAACSSSLGW
jgi:hypothetical protein